MSETEKRKPVLMCRDVFTEKLIHYDIGSCHKRFIFYGDLVPDFPCGNPRNIHYCLSLTSDELKKIVESENTVN